MKGVVYQAINKIKYGRIEDFMGELR